MSNQYKNATSSKIKRIFSSTKGVDCIIIANSNSMDPNFRYLTNFSSGLFEGSFLIISKGRLKLLTSNLEYDTAVSQAHDAIEVIKITNRDQLIKALSSEISGKSIGLNYAFIPYSIYSFIKKAAKPGRITDAYPALLLARLVKDEKEISYIRKAAAITKKAMAAIEERFRVGITEAELASEFDGISASYSFISLLTLWITEFFKTGSIAAPLCFLTSILFSTKEPFAYLCTSINSIGRSILKALTEYLVNSGEINRILVADQSTSSFFKSLLICSL